MSRFPIWRCVDCTETAYSEGRPKGWGWVSGGLRCGACRIQAVVERRKGRRPTPKREPLAPTVDSRECVECGSTFTAANSRQVLCSKSCKDKRSKRAIRERKRTAVRKVRSK